MSANVKNLFNFSRDLPEPFQGMKNKKVKVSSVYGDGTEATLNCSMAKAVNALCGCMGGTVQGAVGRSGTKSMAEYKSSAGDDAYHLAVYDSAKGSVVASVYDAETEVVQSYVLNSSGRDGAAVLMAMMPFFKEDEEFEQQLDIYYEQFSTGFPDRDAAKESLAILCDNAYRRIKDETCPAHMDLQLDASGNLMRVSRSQLDSGKFTPDEVTAGEFTIFASTGPAVIQKAGILVDKEDFEGKYPVSSRTLNAVEQSLVPVLPEWYVIPQEVVDICRHAKESTGKPMQMRNFLLRGPAGTGKTMGAKAVAAGLGLPYMKYTCSAGTEIFDFIGMVFPDTDGGTTGDAALDAEREKLEAMGGITYANVAELMQLPGLDDMDFDPEGVYRSLTGREKQDATTQDCMALVMELVTDKVRALSKKAEDGNNSGQSYTYVETDFIKALKNGYVIEIQEPTTIVQPGVLVGLNSMLEQSGTITLPTGEVIKRHPDAVVVITTNVSYEGCRGMNQSVIDRMSLVKDVELPKPEVMVERVMSVTGAADEYQVGEMVRVVNDLADYCRKNGITDGSYGMRSLIDWVLSTEITGDPYGSAMDTIISKATADPEDREALVMAVLEPKFPPAGMKAAA